MKRRTLPLSIALTLVPWIAFAQSAPKTFCGLANLVVKLLGGATTDLIVLAIVVYFWGIASSLFKEGEKGHERLREQLLWGVVVLFLAVTIFGIVQLLQNTIFGAGLGGGGATAQNCQ